MPALARRQFLKRTFGGIAGVTALGLAPFLDLSSKANPLLIASGLLPKDSPDLMAFVLGFGSLLEGVCKTAGTLMNGGVNLIEHVKQELQETKFDEYSPGKNPPVHEQYSSRFVPQPAGHLMAPIRTDFSKPTYLHFIRYPFLLPYKLARAMTRTVKDLNLEEIKLIKALYDDLKLQTRVNRARQAADDNAAKLAQRSINENPTYPSEANGSSTQPAPSVKELKEAYTLAYWRPLEVVTEWAGLVGSLLARPAEALAMFLYRPRSDSVNNGKGVMIVTQVDLKGFRISAPAALPAIKVIS